MINHLMKKYNQQQLLEKQRTQFRWVMISLAFLCALVFVVLGIWVVKGTEEDHLVRSARAYAKAVDSFRAFYTDVIVKSVIGNPWVEVTEHYRDQPGAIPIPATMTIDLVEFMSSQDENISVRLISDFPFPQRASRTLSEFDLAALNVIRNQQADEYYNFSYDQNRKELSFASPIIMQQTCVACHNNHVDSPKTDWKVGDVRGIQVVSIPSEVVLNSSDYRLYYLIGFVLFAFSAAVSALFYMDSRIRKVFSLLQTKNSELEATTTELKQQQKALDQHAIVSMTDLKGDIIYVNEHFKTISGYADHELLGENHRIINSGYHAQAMFENMWNRVCSGQAWHGELKNINKSGEYYWVTATIMPLYNADGEMDRFISIRTDITQQKKLEHDLKSSNEELFALNLVLEDARREAEAASQTKSAFLANMSHEIRTPMTGIMGMTDLALDTQLTATQRGYLDVVRSSSQALLSILNDILDFSKIDAGKLQIEVVKFELKELVCYCLKPAAVIARKKGISLRLDMPTNIPDICIADPIRLRQVLVNICDNAIKFTEAGQVTVSLRWTADTHATGHLHIDVTDQGIGIPKEKQRLIFDAFAQADNTTTRSFGGTGLGLSICMKLIELMQGHMGVVSQVGKGSRFWFELPCQGAEYNKKILKSVEVQSVFILDKQINNNVVNACLDSKNVQISYFDNRTEFVENIYLASDKNVKCLINNCFGDFSAVEIIHDLIAHDIKKHNIILIADHVSESEINDAQTLGVSQLLTHPVAPVELFNMLEGIEHVPVKERVADASECLSILVAEDNKVNQKLITALITKQGHTVTLVENGLEAWQTFMQNTYDLVLMDMQMPIMGGVDATRSIREHETSHQLPPTPIYAMTANVLPADKQACLSAGMNGHLGKPIKVTELTTLLNSLMKSGVP